ncbi:MAG: acyl-CoA dehydrogenase, partial [Parvibaculaceae bacterium]
MNFEHTDKTKEMIARVEAFMDAHVYPIEKEHHDWNRAPENLWTHWPGIDGLKEKAKAEGLWNLFLPVEYGDLSPGLSNLEYAPLAEIMGRVPFSAELFNCAAPDTGNMEVLAKFGSEQQKKDWLVPLMNGELRSAYLMTEPQVASSDATNI